MTTSDLLTQILRKKYLTLSKRIAQFTALHLIRIRRHRGKASIFQFQNSMMKWF